MNGQRNQIISESNSIPKKKKKDFASCLCCGFLKKGKSNEAKSIKIKATTSSSAKDASKVPFYADLPKDLHTGGTIYISGVVLPNCSRFSVNLTCGKNPSASPDYAFHFNPRLEQRYMVRNSRLNGQWGNEETTSIVKFDFERNKKFLLNIFISQSEFLVSLNGRHICAFGFRVPLSKVTGIEVNGLVEVYGVEYKELKIYPEPIPENKTFTVVVGGRQDEVPETLMDIPITLSLPKGFQRGWQLEIYGRVKILPHSFYINLQEGSQNWPHPNIPLHLSLRFSTEFGEHLFVRNAWIDGKWGQEERAPGFQFPPGSPFTMAIRREDKHFSVWIDGKLAGEFKFRGSIDAVDTIHVQGDVVVTKIFLNENTKS